MRSRTPVTPMVGRRFGRLEVVARAYPNQGTNARWVCLCLCGKVKVVIGYALRLGRSTSCGCQRVHTQRLRAMQKAA